jgi:hypothetical protein
VEDFCFTIKTRFLIAAGFRYFIISPPVACWQMGREGKFILAAGMPLRQVCFVFWRGLICCKYAASAAGAQKEHHRSGLRSVGRGGDLGNRSAYPQSASTATATTED